MKRLNFFLLLFFTLSTWAQTSVKNLRTEYLRNPIGIDVIQPRFSWEMQSDTRGANQSSYELTVSSDEDFAHIVWSSGKMNTDKSVHIPYEGHPLSPSTRYYWKVDVWDNNQTRITSGEQAFFETGLLDSGWGDAQWIQVPTENDNSVDPLRTKYTIEVDMTLINDNAGILFAAKDANNMYMWSINTFDEAAPLIRRHIYVNGNISSSQSSIGAYYSKADLIGKERHVKIDVDNNVIKTYIDNVLIDNFTDTNGKLIHGLVGFRCFKGGNVNEMAYYDNIKLTTYSRNKQEMWKPTVTFFDDFENGSNKFIGSEIEEIAGNKKLHMFTASGDYRVLQGTAGIPMFRNEFRITKEIKSAHIYSSALGIYDLFVNGKRVGTPLDHGKYVYDELKPGWTDYLKTVHYSTYDVTALLQAGNNAIGAHVASGWFTGGISHGEYGSPPLSFITKLVVQYTDNSIEVIHTDTSWKSSTSGPIAMADIYNGEIYNASKESNWTTIGYDDSNWKNVTKNNWFTGKLTAFVGPAIRVRPELQQNPKSITVYKGTTPTSTTYGKINTTQTIEGSSPVLLKKGETAVYNMGQNMVGWVRFAVKGASGAKMKIRFSEMLNTTGDRNRRDDGPAGSVYTESLRGAKATLHYILKGDENGEAFNPTLTFFGFQYCEITATQDIEIQKLVGEVVGSVTEEGASFKTSDASVNQLYSNIQWGQRGNFLSIPTDCPQRDERLGWTGDTQVFSRAAAYNADVAAFFHKWMGDMRDSQREDGAYPSVAPHAWVNYGQSAWAEAGIIVPWNVYQMYADPGIIAENYQSMEKYMDFLASQSGEGYKYNGAGTDFGDWLSYEDTDKRYISVCYYAYAAQLISKMSQALSKSANDMYAQKATKYQTLYNNIKAEFQTRYVNANGTLKQISQTAYLLALKLDLFPNKDATNLAVSYLTQKIVNNGNRLSTGFIGTSMLNQILSQHGANDIAYNLLQQRNNPSWLYSVDQGATTIWERWDSYTIEKGFNVVDMNSFNHYSYGAVSEWMYSFMGGIGLDEANPGFKHIILKPTPDTRIIRPEGQDKITSTSASYPSYYGIITSEWKMKEDGRLIYKATIPANTTATLYLPVLTEKDVVYEGNVLAKKAKGITFVKNENRKAIYRLQSGTYTFQVKK